MLYSNRPEWLFAATDTPRRGVERVLERYAHLSGLAARWELFAPLPRCDYQVIVTAGRADGSSVSLPDPPWRRGHGWLDHLLEHRESKFELNLMIASLYRVPYGRYLCRTVDMGGGQRPVTVVFTLACQPVLPRAQAEALGGHFAAPLPPAVLDTVDCAGASAASS